MKFFAVFAAVVAVALASPAQWTLDELSTAIQDPNTPVFLTPILEEALNALMHDVINGSPQSTTTVSTVVQDFSVWTLHELSEAIQDPATDPDLIIYLEHALNSMMTDIFAGNQPEYVIVSTPVGLLPIEPVVAPLPVDPVMVPMPSETVVEPIAAGAASSPLVQIIVNVKSQQVATPIAPESVVNPQPVVLPPPVVPDVVVNPVVYPQPVVLPPPVAPEVVINPQPVVLPAPVAPEVAPGPVVLPAPVAPVVVPEPGVLPIDIIAVNPDFAINPVDVIAIAAPEVNPIDILAPVPVGPAGVHVVGPIV